MSPEDEQLLRRIGRGDQVALERLYRSYYPRLCRFVLRVTRDPELAREVINDVFLVVWHSAEQFRGESSVSTWILGIAYRKALQGARRQRRATLPETAVEPSEEHRGARHLDLESGLASLSREQRATVELAYFFGYSYREIAEIMDCPENTVKTRMFHARRALKSLLET